jgi:hypothetical protein
MNARKVIYAVKGAGVIQNMKTGALEFRYSIDGIRFNFTLWSEVGEKAKPLFSSFWKEQGCKPSELEKVDHGNEYPFISDKLPTQEQVTL